MPLATPVERIAECGKNLPTEHTEHTEKRSFVLFFYPRILLLEWATHSAIRNPQSARGSELKLKIQRLNQLFQACNKLAVVSGQWSVVG
jgi:hypothetical protein